MTNQPCEVKSYLQGLYHHLLNDCTKFDADWNEGINIVSVYAEKQKMQRYNTGQKPWRFF